LTEKLFTRDGQIGLVIPEAEVQRYHLADGVEIEVVPVEEGILLRPIGVEPWFTVEWERALDVVVEWYGDALTQLGEERPEDEPEEAESAQPREEQPNA
jgi:hypothetical protein